MTEVKEKVTEKVKTVATYIVTDSQSPVQCSTLKEKGYTHVCLGTFSCSDDDQSVLKIGTTSLGLENNLIHTFVAKGRFSYQHRPMWKKISGFSNGNLEIFFHNNRGTVVTPHSYYAELLFIKDD